VVGLRELSRLRPEFDDIDKEVIGANVARLRKAKGLSQTALAKAMRTAGHDWHQNTVSRIENGRQAVHMREMEHLEPVLGGDLLDGTKFAATFAEQWKSFGEEMINRLVQRRLETAESALAKATEELRQLRELLAVKQGEWERRAARRRAVSGGHYANP
jgi:transcriptional regulator with XRE-family HTH domain